MVYLNKNNNQFETDVNRREIAEHQLNGFGCITYVDKYFNNEYKLHWHDEFELSFVAEGSIRIFAGKQSFLLKEGDGAFINSAVIHNYACGEKNVRCVMPNILFDSTMISGNDAFLYTKYVKPILCSPEISYLIFNKSDIGSVPVLKKMQEIFEAADKQEWGYELNVRSMLSSLFLVLFDRMKGIAPDIVVSQSISSKIVSLRLMTEFIRQNISLPLTVKDIADSGSVSVRECQRYFSEYMNTSPNKYVTLVRMEKAKKLLAYSALSVNEICGLCGYLNSSYFSEVFGKHYGVSPLTFRKNFLSQ